jgi:predicted AAA+ superfamily ATPase
LTSKLLAALDMPEVVALVGVRRCGKTTLLYQVVDALLSRGVPAERVLLMNLEDPALASASIDDLVSAHRQSVHPDGPLYLLLDEVQARPGWEAWVNATYERRTGVKIVVTGSASSMLEGDLSALLTGRNLTFRVHPLSFGEYLAFHGVVPAGARSTTAEADAMVHHLDRFLVTGGFPEANLRDPALARMLLQQYFRDIIFRDLVQRHGLDAGRVQDLAQYLAATFARPHTKRALSRAVHLAPDTVRDYLARLEEVFLILTVRRFAWSPKPGPADQAPIKIYVVDTGLRDAVAPEHVRDLGRLAENLVATTLAARDARPAYWTDGKGRHEVDFVVARPGGTVEAYQVTYGLHVPEREEAALRVLRDELPRGQACKLRVLTRTDEGTADGIERVPLWKWLLNTDARPADGP